MGGFSEVDLSGWMRTSRKGMVPLEEGCSWVNLRSSVRELRKVTKDSACCLSLKDPRPSYRTDSSKTYHSYYYSYYESITYKK